MSKYRRRRAKLKAHGRGDNRHEKGVAWADKKARLGLEIARMNGGQKRGASWQVRTSDGSESAVTDRDAELVARDGADSNSARRPNPTPTPAIIRGGRG